MRGSLNIDVAMACGFAVSRPLAEAFSAADAGGLIDTLLKDLQGTVILDSGFLLDFKYTTVASERDVSAGFRIAALTIPCKLVVAKDNFKRMAFDGGPQLPHLALKVCVAHYCYLLESLNVDLQLAKIVFSQCPPNNVLSPVFTGRSPISPR